MKDEKSVRAKEYTRKYTAIYVASAVLCVVVAIALSLTVIKLTEGARVPIYVPGTLTPTQEPTTNAPETDSNNGTEEPTDVPTTPSATTKEPEGKVEIKTSAVGNDQVNVGPLVIVNELRTFDSALAKNSVVVVREQTGLHVQVTTWAIKVTEETFLAINQLQADMKAALSSDYKITLEKGFDETDETKEFGTGLSFRIRFMKGGDSYSVSQGAVSKEYKWIKENAWKYGLILRYPEDKTLQTNHTAVAAQFRYVGKEHAKYMYDNQLCLEEYIDLIKDYTFNEPLVIETEGGKYRVYYIPMADGDSTNVQFRSKSPKETYGSLVVSGDNNEGFIISQQFTEK